MVSHENNLRNVFNSVFGISALGKHKFSGIPWNRGPSGPRLWKRAKILFRIAWTRALYDQMAHQLCLFHVPGQPSKKQFVKKHGLVVRKAPSGKKESPNWYYLYQILIQTGSGWNLPFVRTVSVSRMSQAKEQKARPHLETESHRAWGRKTRGKPTENPGKTRG